jgi:hypothetical protein
MLPFWMSSFFLGVVAVASAGTMTLTPVVQTRPGLLQGIVEDGVNVFHSVPYGAPPIGDLRFRSPEPVASWGGVKVCCTSLESAPLSSSSVLCFPYPECLGIP